MPDPQLARAAAAAQLLAHRRQADPLYHWVPTRPQAEFLAAEAREVWFIGANRAGKSDALAAAIAAHARFGHPDPTPAYAGGGRLEVRDRAVALWVITLTRALGSDTLQPKVFDNGRVPPGQPHAPFIPPWEIADWHATDQLLRLKNGSLIGWRSVDQGALRLAGAGRDGIYFDEAPPKSVYDEATMRVEAGRRLRIRGAATLLPPEGLVGGVSWLYPEKIQPWLAGRRDGLHLVRASLADNPHLLPEEVAELERKFPPGTLEHAIRIRGEWRPGLAGALAYPNFDRRLHVNPTLGPAAKEWRLPLRWCLDWNVSPMPSVVVQKIGRLWRVLDEFALDSGGLARLAQEWRRRYPQHGAPLWLTGDATGRTRHEQTGQDNFTVLAAYLGELPYPVEILVPDQNPPVAARVNAVNGVLRGPDGAIRLEIAPHCVELLADFEQVLRDADGGLKKTTDRRDPYCRRTGWSDALGYELVRDEPVAVGPLDATRRRPTAIPAPTYGFAPGPGPAPGRPGWPWPAGLAERRR